jgi:tripartite-type tricarboxylate transporter receptor subunit TctC
MDNDWITRTPERPVSGGIMRSIAWAVFTAHLALFSPEPARAGPVEDFYHRRNVTLVIGYGPGGGYDFYGRFVARYMPEHIPGRPNIIVQNMPGAGSLTAVNYLFNTAPKDGTVFGTFAREMPMMGILNKNSDLLKYDVRKFTWLGSASSSENDPTLLFVRSGKLTSIRDAFQAGGKSITIGATASGSGGNEWARLMRDVLHLKVNIISGYRDSGGIFLAVENGEVDGRSLDYSAVKAGRPDWLKPESNLSVLLQMGRPTRHPDFPNVPTARELAQSSQQTDLIDVSDLSNTLARPFAAPPGLPPEIAKALQSAFMSTMRDPAVIAEAARLKIELSPIDGAEVLKRIDRLANTAPDVLDVVRAIRSDVK